jgi:molecular chaperone DnaK
MTAPDLVVGIDLGTTNSSIAVVLDDKITVIPVAGQPSMPSAVGIDPAGRLIIGQPAKNQSVSAPENTVLSVKRLMGTETTVLLGGKPYRPEEISALILGELKSAAELHLGRPVTHAVITVPAFFNERQRQATTDAGRLAGLEVLRIINEPTAAALAYGAGSTGNLERETLLVFDLGGGTFDVSLVTVENGVVEVRASHGDTQLGGDDFDLLLAQEAESRFLKQQPDSTLSKTTQLRLKAALEQAKIRLSEDPFTSVREEYLTPDAHLDSEFSRVEYEALILPLLEKTLTCLQRSLSDAGVTASEVDKIMLVGGATRTPLVHEVLADRLGKEPRHEINPDLIVAMGAAIQGASLAGKPAPAILIDITAHTYSIAAIFENSYPGLEPVLGCAPIVRRGTPLPVRKSECFRTFSDNQKSIEVIAYQGESEFPSENLEIGKFTVENLAAVPAGNEVIVEFQIDLNGLLKVTATEKRTGLAKSAVIDTAEQHRLNLDAARTNLAALFNETGSDPFSLPADEFFSTDPESAGAGTAVTPAASSLIATTKSLRRRAEALLERGVAPSDAQDIRDHLGAMTEALQKSDWETLSAKTDQLSDVLFFLED